MNPPAPATDARALEDQLFADGEVPAVAAEAEAPVSVEDDDLVASEILVQLDMQNALHYFLKNEFDPKQREELLRTKTLYYLLGMMLEYYQATTFPLKTVRDGLNKVMTPQSQAAAATGTLDYAGVGSVVDPKHALNDCKSSIKTLFFEQMQRMLAEDDDFAGPSSQLMRERHPELLERIISSMKSSRPNVMYQLDKRLRQVLAQFKTQIEYIKSVLASMLIYQQLYLQKQQQAPSVSIEHVQNTTSTAYHGNNYIVLDENPIYAAEHVAIDTASQARIAGYYLGMMLTSASDHILIQALHLHLLRERKMRTNCMYYVRQLSKELDERDFRIRHLSDLLTVKESSINTMTSNYIKEIMNLRSKIKSQADDERTVVTKPFSSPAAMSSTRVVYTASSQQAAPSFYYNASSSSYPSQYQTDPVDILNKMLQDYDFAVLAKEFIAVADKNQKNFERQVDDLRQKNTRELENLRRTKDEHIEVLQQEFLRTTLAVKRHLQTMNKAPKSKLIHNNSTTAMEEIRRAAYNSTAAKIWEYFVTYDLQKDTIEFDDDSVLLKAVYGRDMTDLVLEYLKEHPVVVALVHDAVKDLLRERSSLAERVKDLESKVQIMTEDVQMARAVREERDILSYRYEEATTTVAQLKSLHEELAPQLEETTKQLAERTTEVRHLTSEYHTLERNNSALQELVRYLRDEVTELQSKLDFIYNENEEILKRAREQIAEARYQRRPSLPQQQRQPRTEESLQPQENRDIVESQVKQYVQPKETQRPPRQDDTRPLQELAKQSSAQQAKKSSAPTSAGPSQYQPVQKRAPPPQEASEYNTTSLGITSYAQPTVRQNSISSNANEVINRASSSSSSSSRSSAYSDASDRVESVPPSQPKKTTDVVQASRRYSTTSPALTPRTDNPKNVFDASLAEAEVPLATSVAHEAAKPAQYHAQAQVAQSHTQSLDDSKQLEGGISPPTYAPLVQGVTDTSRIRSIHQEDVYEPVEYQVASKAQASTSTAPRKSHDEDVMKVFTMSYAGKQILGSNSPYLPKLVYSLDKGPDVLYQDTLAKQPRVRLEEHGPIKFPPLTPRTEERQQAQQAGKAPVSNNNNVNTNNPGEKPWYDALIERNKASAAITVQLDPFDHYHGQEHSEVKKPAAGPKAKPSSTPPVGLLSTVASMALSVPRHKPGDTNPRHSNDLMSEVWSRVESKKRHQKM